MIQQAMSANAVAAMMPLKPKGTIRTNQGFQNVAAGADAVETMRRATIASKVKVVGAAEVVGAVVTIPPGKTPTIPTIEAGSPRW
jgi:hypothetical protein